MSSQARESVTVLEECIDLQKRKSQDYQNPNSNIVQSMHYRRGVSTIHDMIAQKLLRAQSLIEPLENGVSGHPNFESIEDTYKDLINYASFAVSYLRGKMEGQDPQRDIFNRRIPSFEIPPCETIQTLKAEIAATPVTDAAQFLNEAPVEEKIKNAYTDLVAPVGMITAPVDEPLINDPIMAAYLTSVAETETVKDVMDRIDEDHGGKLCR